MRILPSISSRNLRIAGASLIAVLMVAGGYVLPGLTFPETKAVNAELTDDILASYVAKDTDSDGLPDWQETLYGTDSNVPDTDGDGVTDGEAVRRGLLTPRSLSSQLPQEPIGEEDIPGEAPAPGSFTERFSRAFFEAYIKASGGEPMSAEAQEKLINDLLATYASEAGRSLVPTHTRVSIRTDASLDLIAYAARVEGVLQSLPQGENSDMFALSQDLIENDEAEAGTRLGVVGNQYSAASRQLLAMSAPLSFVDAHLQLVNGLEEAGRAAKAVSTYKEDPLLTMGALTVLSPARADILQAINTLAEAVLMRGEPAPGTPGAVLVETARYAQQP